MTLLSLYLTFAGFGLLCFGGGYMLVPLLQRAFVPEVLEPVVFGTLLSVAQVTPGPIGINTATYVGFTLHGVFGAVLATAGMVTPCLGLVVLALSLLRRHAQSWFVRGFLRGMQPMSFGLILAAAVIFAEMSVFSGPVPWLEPAQWSGFLRSTSLWALALAGISAWLLFRKKLPMTLLLVLCAAVGAVFGWLGV